MSESNFSLRAPGAVKVNNFANPDKLATALARIYVPSKEKKKSDTKLKGANSTKYDETPHMSALNQIVDSTTSIHNDNLRTAEILPDVELAIKVLSSSIVSPNDLGDAGFAYGMSDNNENAEAMKKIAQVVGEYMEENYKFSETLEANVRDMIAESGSVIRAIIPETSLDVLINGEEDISVEALKSHYHQVSTLEPEMLGLIGGKDIQDVSFESLLDGTFRNVTYKPVTMDGLNSSITIYDNPTLLREPILHKRMIEQHVKERLGLTRTSFETIAKERKRRRKKEEPEEQQGETEVAGVVLNETPRDSKLAENQEMVTGDPHKQFCRPLVMFLPAGSVIPVHRRNEPGHHIGYYVLLEKGQPIVRNQQQPLYAELKKRITSNASNQASEQVQQVWNELIGERNEQQSTNAIEDIIEAYRAKIETNFKDALKNGIYGEYGTISIPEEIMEMMMVRDLQQKATRVLFLPSELVSYMAFEHRPNGTGKTRLEKGRIIHSMRALTLMANSIASVRNSMRVKDIKCIIDKDDPDPVKTGRIMIEEYFKREGAQYPLGDLSPVNLMSYVQNNGINVTYEGNTRLPMTNTVVTERNHQTSKVDTEYEQKQKEQGIMSLGLPPRAVDNTIEADFATTIASSNIMVAKQVRADQKIVSAKYTELTKQIARVSGELRTLIAEAIKDIKFKPNDESLTLEEFVLDAIEYIELSLPEPDTSKIKVQREMLSNFIGMLDVAMDAQISRDTFGRGIPELEDGIEPMRQAIRSMMIRDFMTEHNIMPELMRITELVDGKSIIHEQYKDHIQQLLAAVGEMAKDLGKADRKHKESEDKRIADEEARKNASDAESSTDEPDTDEGTEDTDSTDTDLTIEEPGSDESDDADTDLTADSDSSTEEPTEDTKSSDDIFKI